MNAVSISALVLISLVSCTPSIAGPPGTQGDSVMTKEKIKLFHWRLTPRIHSKGVFTYGGQIGTDNPAFDINLTLEYKKWGLLIYKGIDLKDHTTDYNFSLLAIFRNFSITKNLTITPYLGSILEQADHFADEGSDVATIIVTAYKVNPHFTLEHTAFIGNMVFEPTHMDWVNRLRLIYAGKHLDIISSVWHNNDAFDHSSYLTSGLNIAYSRMKISKHVFLSTGVTGFVTLDTSDEEENPSRNRVAATLAAQWVH